MFICLSISYSSQNLLSPKLFTCFSWTAEHVEKFITWKRTTSSRSKSSKNPLASAIRDDVSDCYSDFVEEFCMIAGSHSSTIDRLYAWERKLYDEVKIVKRYKIVVRPVGVTWKDVRSDGCGFPMTIFECPKNRTISVYRAGPVLDWYTSFRTCLIEYFHNAKNAHFSAKIAYIIAI
ncbi:uncharacterized protein [Euphorbia lathyris]|uniref:uncharacterized protein isoform X2 n=1 Tax=Euphorbia lathyris TaxID=212925 RepID=UPI0033139CE3